MYISRILLLTHEVLRYAISAVFLVAGLSKLYAPYDFLSALYSYQLWSPQFGLAIAIALPWLEFCLGMCLAFRILPSGSYLVGTLLGITFFIARALAVEREILIGCGCFATVTGRMLGVWDLVLSMGFLCGIIFLWATEHSFNRNAKLEKGGTDGG